MTQPSVRSPAVPEVPVPVMSDDDLRRLFKTCEGKTYDDRRDIAIMRLFCDTGMRRSELAYLKVSDVDLDKQIAVVVVRAADPGPARSG